MSNSPLVSYTKLSPNHSGKRTHVIDTVSIHCMAGNLTVENCGAMFAQSSAQASANYGIGSDGRIALYVDEGNRSWCTSNAANDQRAVTIEVANTEAKDPWPVSDAAYESLIKLLVDICQRNGIQQLLWKGDKSLIGQVDKQNMTVHRWFAAKACPGDYLYSRHGAIAEEVNRRLNAAIAITPMNAKGAVTASSLNIRSGPGTSNSVIGGLTKGCAVTITGSYNGWYRIKSGSADNAWVSAQYITIQKQTQTAQQKEDNDMVITYKTLNEVPDDFRPTIQKLMEKGALCGEADPDPTRLDDNVLNLSYDYCRVMTSLDRLGKLD